MPLRLHAQPRFPVRAVRLVLGLAGLAAGLGSPAAPAADAPDTAAGGGSAAASPAGDSPSETLATHRLHELVDRQRALFALAAQGGAQDKEAFKGQVQALVHEYDAFLSANADSAPGFANYGYLLWKIGMRREAVGMLLKADSLDPAVPLVKNELGNFLAEEGKPLEAYPFFVAAAGLAPNEPLYQYQIGTLLHEARDDFLGGGGWKREALDRATTEAFHRAATLAPDRIEFTYRYAESFEDVAHPDWDAALRQWRSLEPGAASEAERQTILLREANVLIKAGRPAEARALMDRVTLPGLQGQKQKLVAPGPAPAGS